MKPLTVVITAAILVLPAMAATVVDIDFDGPGYVAGQQPPTPWSEEWDNTLHTVEAGVGYEGTQGLVVRESGGAGRGVVYDLPEPLTSDMGEVSISIVFNPQGLSSGYNFSAQGGLQIGWGSKRYGTGEMRGVLFQHVNGNPGIYGPGSMWGTLMGSFSPHHWYRITFDIDEDWEGMTLSAEQVGQEPVSMWTAWSGNAITRIWTPGNQDSTRSAIYDNLVVTTTVTCPSADLTGNCQVGLADFSILAGHWFSEDCVAPQWCQGADLDASGTVDLDDLAELVAQWLGQDA